LSRRPLFDLWRATCPANDDATNLTEFVMGVACSAPYCGHHFDCRQTIPVAQRGIDRLMLEALKSSYHSEAKLAQ